MAAASTSQRMPRQSKGEITSEQLRATKAELARIAQEVTLRDEAVSEKLAAASLAEQIQALRNEREREEKEARAAGTAVATLGRISTYTDDVGDALVTWITEGHSLSSWCRQSGVPVMTVNRWLRERADLRERYAQAHDDRADVMAENMMDIADAVAETESIAAVQAAKLRIETRKWIAAKLKPQKWGDKQIIEQRGNVTFQLAVGRQGQQTPPPLVIDAEPATIPNLINGLPPRLSDCESDSQT